MSGIPKAAVLPRSRVGQGDEVSFFVEQKGDHLLLDRHGLCKAHLRDRPQNPRVYRQFFKGHFFHPIPVSWGAAAVLRDKPFKAKGDAQEIR
jgi:hypothetical protein